MGQYFMPYVKKENSVKVFENKVDGEFQGLKLMEHSYWRNGYVGNVINEIYYSKARVCWVGDYYDEDNYSQVNCDSATTKEIGDLVWTGKVELTPCTKANKRSLADCLLVNHTKKLFINCNEYYERNKWFEEWQGKKYPWCVSPLPLLTCSGNHSGGSYYGINQDKCGTWFNDLLEVVDDYDQEELLQNGYQEFVVDFKE